MVSQELFVESLADAVSSAINQLGGAKRVGTMLWPEKSAREAGNQLLNCLNPEHSQKLSLEQIDFILDTARKSDVHDIQKYMCDRYGYEFKPITVEAIRATTEQKIESHLSALRGEIDRLERLKK